MRKVMMVLFVVFSASTVHAQTARQYFTELRNTNSFNEYFAKYVCFHDEDKPGFVIVSPVEDVLDAMTRNENKEGAKAVAKVGKGLFVQTFYKGVSNGDPILYDRIAGEYRLDFDAPIHHGRMVYRINWKTGRYRLLVYALDHNKNVPAEEISGKCELIHPGDKSSIVEEK